MENTIITLKLAIEDLAALDKWFSDEPIIPFVFNDNKYTAFIRSMNHGFEKAKKGVNTSILIEYIIPNPPTIKNDVEIPKSEIKRIIKQRIKHIINKKP